MTKQTLKRWIISTLVTFAGGFSISLLAGIDELTIETLKDGSIIGFVFVCTRQGVKLVLETFVFWFNNNRQ